MKKLSLGLCGFLLVIGTALIEKKAFAADYICSAYQSTACLEEEMVPAGVLRIPLRTIRAVAQATRYAPDTTIIEISRVEGSPDSLSFINYESQDDVFVH